MRLRMAFAGFRHGHILSLYALARRSDAIEVVTACEADPATREELRAGGKVEITHTDVGAMLDEAACDAVAIGDFYAARGPIAIQAMEAGKHVIADKPLCTRLDELDRIETLAQAGPRVGCMLDLRDSPKFLGVRDLVRQGAIGEVHAVTFGGQHPLSRGSRPGWYFEPGKHGGTINDIAVHAVDLIPWITGLRFTTVNAARSWNAFADDVPHFKDAGQVMLTMDNGCGVLGDVSYFIPDTQGYTFPLYWRTTFWGRQGVIETASPSESILIGMAGEKEVRRQPLGPGAPGGYLTSFLHDIAGAPDPDGLSTDTVLRASRVTLTAQHAADQGLREVAV